MATIQIIFNDAALAGIKRRASLVGKPLDVDFIGPTFEEASLAHPMYHGTVTVITKEQEAYIYNVDEISRIRMVDPAETVTESGIIVAAPPKVVSLVNK